MRKKIKCSICKEIKVETWIFSDYTENRKDQKSFRCNYCREKMTSLTKEYTTSSFGIPEIDKKFDKSTLKYGIGVVKTLS